MDYLLGSFYILKNKIWYWDFFRSVPRIEAKLPWYRQYGYFYSSSFPGYELGQGQFNINEKITITGYDNINGTYIFKNG